MHYVLYPPTKTLKKLLSQHLFSYFWHTKPPQNHSMATFNLLSMCGFHDVSQILIPNHCLKLMSVVKTPHLADFPPCALIAKLAAAPLTDFT